MSPLPLKLAPETCDLSHVGLGLSQILLQCATSEHAPRFSQAYTAPSCVAFRACRAHVLGYEYTHTHKHTHTEMFFLLNADERL